MDNYVRSLLALAPSGNQVKFSSQGKVIVGFFKKGTLSLSRQTNRQADRYLNAVAALAQAGNQIKFNLADKLGLGPANWEWKLSLNMAQLSPKLSSNFIVVEYSVA